MDSIAQQTERQTGIPKVRVQILLEPTFFSWLRQCQIIVKSSCLCVIPSRFLGPTPYYFLGSSFGSSDLFSIGRSICQFRFRQYFSFLAFYLYTIINWPIHSQSFMLANLLHSTQMTHSTSFRRYTYSPTPDPANQILCSSFSLIAIIMDIECVHAWPYFAELTLFQKRLNAEFRIYSKNLIRNLPHTPVISSYKWMLHQNLEKVWHLSQ